MRNFAANGVRVDRLAQKLWLAAKIQGHRNPFGKPLVEYNVAQLDFILEMAARDEPERYSFVRANAAASETVSPQTMAAWTDVLIGRLSTGFLDTLGITEANKAIALYNAKRGFGLKPGFSREGKPIDAGGNTDRGHAKTAANGAARSADQSTW
jgi:hypothetical protein